MYVCVVHSISLYGSVDTVFESSAKLSFLQLCAYTTRSVQCSPCATAHISLCYKVCDVLHKYWDRSQLTNHSANRPNSQQTHFSLALKHTHTHTQFATVCISCCPNCERLSKLQKKNCIQV